MALSFMKYEQVNKVVLLPVSSIDPNPHQPRRVFEQKGIEELAKSIEENGLISPVTVRKNGKRFELIAGERRLCAFRAMNRDSIPAIIETVDEHRSAVMALVENLQRRELNFLEESIAISSLIKTYGLTQQQVADRLGLAQSTVANKLRLLKLDAKVVQMFLEAGLTERHARALLPLSNDKRLLTAAKQVIDRQMNVSQTERYVEELQRKKQPQKNPLFIIKDFRIFMTTVNRAVDIMKQAGIEVDTCKAEDEQNITVTITIPKDCSAKGRTTA